MKSWWLWWFAAPTLDRAVRFILPSLNVCVKLSLTQTGNEGKGILFWKRSEGSSSESLNSIDMQIAAVPRSLEK